MNNKELKLIKRLSKIKLARKYIWYYAQAKSPTFFSEDKWFLQKIANTIQGAIDGTIINPKTNKPYRKIMINIQPQVGKSRTVTNAIEWILGNNPEERIIYTSYNDTVASKFSRYIRDAINQEHTHENDENIIFRDIFPDVKLSQNNRSVQRWALEGQHFNFLAAGIGGSVTSEGGSIIIVDDPIKNASEAFNELELERKWEWYTGTLLSRVSAETSDPIEIIIMTRWSKNDICGRLLAQDDHNEWYVIQMEAYHKDNYKKNKEYLDSKTWNSLTENDRKMLSPRTFKYERYKNLRNLQPEMIFLANYHQKTVDEKNNLYGKFKTYDISEAEGLTFDNIYAMVDLADKGEDFLVSIIYGVKVVNGNMFHYVLDVYMTDDGYSVTMEEVAKRLAKFKVMRCKIENNYGGDAFLLGVQEKVEFFGNPFIEFISERENGNKEQKIRQYAHIVNDRIVMPSDWKMRFPEFFNHVTGYQRIGKNSHDDPEDVLSNMAKEIAESYGGFDEWVRLL
jgi:predicted phage terminase large subunit-like protein